MNNPVKRCRKDYDESTSKSIRYYSDGQKLSIHQKNEFPGCPRIITTSKVVWRPRKTTLV